MYFYSTNNKYLRAGLKEAVLKGLADDGGLYMSSEIPVLPEAFIASLPEASFHEIAFRVSHAFFYPDIREEPLRKIIQEAFHFPVPLVKVHDRVYSLELFHGPTLAFKDFGARFMSRVFRHFHNPADGKLHVLVATSGDTGSAVASGFFNVEGIHVTILYPKGMVSELQEKQFTTLGHNITAIRVDGTFDDCQKLVKEAFVDRELKKEILLTSANSINLARIIPQSFYYFYAYGQWKKQQDTSDEVVFSVPSGNFGNLFGGLLAAQMGLPVHHFVAATNINDVVPEYLKTSVFSPRPSQPTIANAMDVGNPSNFARITDLFGNAYHSIISRIKGYRYTDEEVRKMIRNVFDAYGYVLDPHGAIGYMGIMDDLKNTRLAGIFLETAHPAKFKEEVEKCILSTLDYPVQLEALLDKTPVFEEMKPEYNALKNILLTRNRK